MAILTFQKPDKVLMLEADNNYGKFEFRPLEPGYGITIGNSLRRILLSSLEGFAITSIRIDGIDHEFSSIPGVIEDVTRIILNLKKVRFKQVVKSIENEKVSIYVSGVEKFVPSKIEQTFLFDFQNHSSKILVPHKIPLLLILKKAHLPKHPL